MAHMFSFSPFFTRLARHEMSWTYSETGMPCWQILLVPKGALFVDRSVRYLGAVDRNAGSSAMNMKLSTVKRWIIELDDGTIYRKALYLMVKTMVSCRFSLTPIHWLKRWNGTEVLISSCLRRDWNGYSLLKLLRRVRLGSGLLIALEKSLAAMWLAKESDLKFQELNTAHLWKIMSIPWYSMV